MSEFNFNNFFKIGERVYLKKNLLFLNFRYDLNADYSAHRFEK